MPWPVSQCELSYKLQSVHTEARHSGSSQSLDLDFLSSLIPSTACRLGSSFQLRLEPSRSDARISDTWLQKQLIALMHPIFSQFWPSSHT